MSKGTWVPKKAAKTEECWIRKLCGHLRTGILGGKNKYQISKAETHLLCQEEEWEMKVYQKELTGRVNLDEAASGILGVGSL